MHTQTYYQEQGAGGRSGRTSWSGGCRSRGVKPLPSCRADKVATALQPTSAPKHWDYVSAARPRVRTC